MGLASARFLDTDLGNSILNGALAALTGCAFKNDVDVLNTSDELEQTDNRCENNDILSSSYQTF